LLDDSVDASRQRHQHRWRRGGEDVVARGAHVDLRPGPVGGATAREVADEPSGDAAFVGTEGGILLAGGGDRDDILLAVRRDRDLATAVRVDAGVPGREDQRDA
jgi:hypothetical protein